MSKNKVEQFNPPTEADLAKRKLYGGGKVDIPPHMVERIVKEDKQGRGWHKDNTRHRDVALKWHQERKLRRVTPEYSKESKIKNMLNITYHDGYMARLDEVGDAGIDKDVKVISDGVKTENNFVKADDKVVKEGKEESVDVEEAKVELEKKIREYEDKADDKFVKEVDDEVTVANKRADNQVEFETKIREARTTIDKYKTGGGGIAAAREKEIKDNAAKEAIEQEKRKESESRSIRSKITDRTKKRDRLNNNITSAEKNTLPKLKADVIAKQNEYDNAVNSLEMDAKDDKSLTPEFIEIATKNKKNKLDQSKALVDKKEEEIDKMHGELIELNAELSKLSGVGEKKKEVKQEKKKVRWQDTAEYKKYHSEKSKGGFKSDRSIGDKPKTFGGSQKAWEDFSPEQRHTHLTNKYSAYQYYNTYPNERPKGSSDKQKKTDEKKQEKRDIDVPTNYEGTDEEWKKMGRNERIDWHVAHPESKDKGGSYKPKSKPKSRPYKSTSELPSELQVKRRVNVDLVSQYKRRHPVAQHRIVLSDKGLEFADEEVLDSYLKIVIAGNREHIKEEETFLYNNIEYNRKEYNRTNNTTY
jgi:hypothetical protein